MVFITAEIGINHNGDVNIAKQLIDMSVKAGCDAVKFQKRIVEKIYPKETLDSPRNSPWGKTVRDQKLGLEFKKKEYNEISQYCKEKNIDWYASAWDLDSQKFLRQYNLKYNKIASAMLTNHNFLQEVAQERKYTFISTGMSTMDQVKQAVKIFREKNCPFELMHTNSSYPMKLEEANLRCIQTLKKEFNCKVGYSGHETAGYIVCVAAVTLGATSIERHISLDRAMYGSDQAVSLEARGLERMVKDVRMVDALLGDGIKKVWESEIKIMKKLRPLEYLES